MASKVFLLGQKWAYSNQKIKVHYINLNTINTRVTRVIRETPMIEKKAELVYNN